jgi:hypothetical protein
MRRLPSDGENPTLIDNLALEDGYIHGDPFRHDYIRIRDRIERLTVRNAYITGGADKKGAFITAEENGSIGSLRIDGFAGEGLREVLRQERPGSAERLEQNGVFLG